MDVVYCRGPRMGVEDAVKSGEQYSETPLILGTKCRRFVQKRR